MKSDTCNDVYVHQNMLCYFVQYYYYIHYMQANNLLYLLVMYILYLSCVRMLDKPIAVAPSVEPTEVPPVKAASSQRTEHRVSVICFETRDIRVHCTCILLQVASQENKQRQSYKIYYNRDGMKWPSPAFCIVIPGIPCMVQFEKK